MHEPVPEPARDPLAELLARCALRDRAAFAELYWLTAPRLNAVALRLLGQRTLAEDVLQEAYTKIWYRAESYRQELAAPMTWLTAVVRHQALDHLAEQRRSGAVFDRTVVVEELDPPDRAAEDQQQRWSGRALRRLDDCLAVLRDDHRRCIRQIYLDGLSYREVADRLAIPLGTAKVWVRRGLERLKTCLEH